ncbi:MAG: MFS transporter [Candidatus Zixiibacteriota bacterium]|jgi:MFS family permease
MSDSQAKKGGPGVLRTFRALRHRDYRLWWFSQMVSLTGTWVQLVAQNWLVYRLTGSPAMLGLVNFVSLVPSLPMSLWAGSLADRFDKRRIVLIAQTTLFVQAAVLAVLTLTGQIQVWHVMVLALVAGLAQALDMPSRQSYVIELVGKEDLTNAIALNSTIFNIARSAGPAVAGILVAALGEGLAFSINAVSFLPVIGALLIMSTSSVRRKINSSPGRQIARGIKYAGKNTLVWVIISIVGVSAFFVMPYSVLMPVYAREVFGGGADIYGFLMTCAGLGALAGALVVASLGNRSRRGLILTVANVAFAGIVFSFAFVRAFWLAAALLVAAGFCFVMQNSLANTLIQVNVADRFRGRIMSIYFLVFMSSMRLGSLQAGYVARYVDVHAALLIGAGASLVWGALVAWRFPRLRNTR